MPLPSDALSVVIAPGAPPGLITEYMPGGDGAQIINTATTGTIWVGSSYAVSPADGVPVNAGASIQWTQSQQLWAVPDPANTDPITLIVSDRINSWTPSPEAVAAAVATELAAEGVPNVMLSKLLYAGLMSKAPILNVSKWASLLIRIGGTTSGGFAAASYTVNNSAYVIDENIISNYGPTGVIYQIPLEGDSFDLSVITGDADILVIGTNRELTAPHLNSPLGIGTYAAAFTGVSGSPAYHTLTDGNGNGLSNYAGPCTLEIQVVNASAVPSGAFLFNFAGPSGAATNVIVARSTQLVGNTGHTQILSQPWVHPRCAGYWSYYDGGVAGATTANVWIHSAP